MGKINRLRIRRFKRLEEITFDPKLATVFVGGNNSGKSSILQALHFAVAVAQSASLVSSEGWNNEVYCSTFRPEQLIYTPSAELQSLGYNGALREQPETWIEVEISEADNRNCHIAIGRDLRGNVTVRMEGKDLGREIQDISRPYSIYAPGLAGIARQETVLSQGVIRRVVARGDANLVLRNVIFWLFQRQKEDATDWEQFQNDIRELFPNLNVRVAFTDISDEHIQVTFSLSAEEPELPLDCAGTAILQAMQVLAYINLFKPRLLLLDEPDSHMHPNNQTAICKLLIRLAKARDFQALIATHSRHVFSAMRDDVPIAWVRKGAIEQDVPVDTTRLLLDIGALDSLDYLGHPGLRCVVLSEDSDTENLKSVLEASGFNLAQTALISYNGCSKSDTVLALSQLLRDKAPHLNLVIHRDRDYLSDEEVARYMQLVTDSGARPFITQFSDIEGHLLTAEHIHAAHPTVTLDRATAILEEATTLTREASIADIVNLRVEQALKRRGQGHGNPNVGQIAVQAAHDFDANPQLMRRGKRVIARVKLLLQQELGMHARLGVSTDALRCEPLRVIADALWPPVAAQH